MYSPSAALEEILSRVRPPTLEGLEGLEGPEGPEGRGGAQARAVASGTRRGVERVPLAEAVGRVLAEPAVSDLDLPPFEKSAMDGFAVHSADCVPPGVPAGPRGGQALPGAPNRPTRLSVIGEARAGEPFTREVPRGACVAIYTGAEIPAGLDAVVMVEHTEREADAVLIGGDVRPGQNVCHRGQDIALGGTVLAAGKRIRAADVSVLASVGCDPTPVYARPRVAILTTGDELVLPSAKPGPGQIREGNTLLLAAMTRALGADVVRCEILVDELDVLTKAFAEALETCDALVTTGGVSMGKYDLVGAALEAVGAENVFHKVRIKPGKPLWFGLARGVPIFALPGNPVSCLVGHAVFVRPALLALAGDVEALAENSAERPRARWAGPTTEPNWREQYVPVLRRVAAEGTLELAPVRWNGSGDVVGLARADALARIPFDVSVATGELVDYLALS